MNTLDLIFNSRLSGSNLLKLDLQGHEIEALNGAHAILTDKIEFAIIETSLFVEHAEPKILELLKFMDEKGFDMFDITAAGRRKRDLRLRQLDVVFVKRGSRVHADRTWD